MDAVFFLAGFFLIVGLVAGLVALVSRKFRRLFQSPMEQLAALLGVPANEPLVAQRHGRSFTVKYTASSRNSPAFLRISTAVDTASGAKGSGSFEDTDRQQVDKRPHIVMRRESWKDRLGKTLGLNREITVGDSPFDDAVYLESDSEPGDVQATLKDARLRVAVRERLDAGARSVVLGHDGLHLEHACKSVKDSASLLDQSMAQLEQIASLLPRFKPGLADKPAKLYADIAIGIVEAAVLFYLVGTAGVAPLGNQPLYAGIGLGLVLWALVTLLLVGLLRGRSDSLRRIGVLSASLLVCIPWCTYLTLCEVNRQGDGYSETSHHAAILNAWTTKPKSKTYYHIEVASWRPEEATAQLDISPEFAQQAKAGRRVEVTTRTGRFGWEWVQTVRMSPASPG